MTHYITIYALGVLVYTILIQFKVDHYRGLCVLPAS